VSLLINIDDLVSRSFEIAGSLTFYIRLLAWFTVRGMHNVTEGTPDEVGKNLCRGLSFLRL
jgi:hypothetical protein